MAAYYDDALEHLTGRYEHFLALKDAKDGTS